MRRINIIQGETYVSDEKGLVVSTVLGSCVAACLHDPLARIGGMNHFLLPDGPDGRSAANATSFGVHAMELLINGLLSRGADKRRIQAKLFGGARLFQGLGDIGGRNAQFANRFLADEGITVVGSSLGGESGRRVEYEPSSGRARQLRLEAEEEHRLAVAPPVRPPSAAGDLELF